MTVDRAHYVGKTLADLMLEQDPRLKAANVHAAYDTYVATQEDVQKAIELGTGFPGSLIEILSQNLGDTF